MTSVRPGSFQTRPVRAVVLGSLEEIAHVLPSACSDFVDLVLLGHCIKPDRDQQPLSFDIAFVFLFFGVQERKPFIVVLVREVQGKYETLRIVIMKFDDISSSGLLLAAHLFKQVAINCTYSDRL